MNEKTIVARQEALRTRLEGIRGGYDACLGDMTAELANNGSEWSVLDLLRHVNGNYYQNTVSRLLAEENPDFGARGGFDLEAAWKRTVDITLAQVDEALGMAWRLTTDQLQRTGSRGDQMLVLIDLLETWADHLQEHLTQLRDEIRPREGLAALQ